MGGERPSGSGRMGMLGFAMMAGILGGGLAWPTSAPPPRRPDPDPGPPPPPVTPEERAAEQAKREAFVAGMIAAREERDRCEAEARAKATADAAPKHTRENARRVRQAARAAAKGGRS